MLILVFLVICSLTLFSLVQDFLQRKTHLGGKGWDLFSQNGFALLSDVKSSAAYANFATFLKAKREDLDECYRALIIPAHREQQGLLWRSCVRF